MTKNPIIAAVALAPAFLCTLGSQPSNAGIMICLLTSQPDQKMEDIAKREGGFLQKEWLDNGQRRYCLEDPTTGNSTIFEYNPQKGELCYPKRSKGCTPFLGS